MEGEWTIFSPFSALPENLHAIKLQSVSQSVQIERCSINFRWLEIFGGRWSTPLGLKIEFNYAS